MNWELPWVWFWVILSAFSIVGEVFTAGFFILPFGIGAAAAAALAWFDIGLVWQWVTFIVVSVALLLPLKRFADHLSEGAEEIGVASDRVIGKIGLRFVCKGRYGTANGHGSTDVHATTDHAITRSEVDIVGNKARTRQKLRCA